MALSEDVVSQFAKAIVPKEEPKEATINGTFKTIDGKEYVQLDGSDIFTPVETSVVAETDDRVKVLIKEHSATVIGNITSPSARSKDLNTLRDEVDEFGNTIQQMDNTIIQQGNSIIQIDNVVNQHSNTLNQHDTIINQHGDRITSIGNTVVAQGNAIEANNNSIIAQGNVIDSMNNTITEHGNNITSINNTVSAQGNQITQNSNIIEQQGNIITQQGNTITQQGNTITQQNNVITQQGNVINEQGSNITILNSAFTIDQGVLTGLSEIIVNSLKTNYLNSTYANIDFANINMAAVEKLFTDSGIIKDLVVQSGAITGELVGVTIKGDLIEANSLKADKLVVKGEDGLYYKLNIDGINNVSTSQTTKFVVLSSKPSDWDTNYKDYYRIVNNEYTHITGNTPPTWSANTYYKLSSVYETALDGTNIVAKSVTADKVQVNDLVAFGATIGGFVIGNASIHTISKTGIDSDINGLYLGADGQLYLGDANNHIKYYKKQNNTWALDITAEDIHLGTSSISNIMVTNTTQEYAVNNSAITPPAQSSLDWSENQPTRGEGQYIWARIKTTYQLEGKVNIFGLE